jgi:hypothetical protein
MIFGEKDSCNHQYQSCITKLYTSKFITVSRCRSFVKNSIIGCKQELKREIVLQYNPPLSARS